MKSINKILNGLNAVEIHGENRDFPSNISFSSKEIDQGGMFIAVKGTKFDGHSFIESAIRSGAKYIVCEKLPDEKKPGVCYIRVKDSHKSLGIIAARYFDNPSEKLKLVGVTGTNGKTTIVTLLYELFLSLGYCSGLISTIKVVFNGKERIASHTTPDPIQIQKTLHDMVEDGCEYVFMEVSSHAIHQKRIEGLKFKAGIFTNLSHDHLDYHKDFDSYRDSKKLFFDQLPESAFALFNRDDKNGKIMVQNTRAEIHSYGLKSDADFKASLLEMHLEGNRLELDGHEIWTRLPGKFNACNLLAVYGAGLLLGVEKIELLKVLSKLQSVEGRFEILNSGSGPTAIVDYAHTPDALKNVLKTIRLIRPDDRIITIVGAGGDRDKTKRPEMAKIAADLSEHVILTSDNPRSEDPASIIEDMKNGLDAANLMKVLSIIDRSEAIKTGCALANSGDIVLIAGKGHETFQEIKGVKSHFDDREKLREYLNI